VAGPRRDDFPNNFVGDLVKTERGWVVVPPTCCPAGHDYGDGGWSARSGAPATHGAVPAGRCFTHRNPARTVESATAAQSRCTRTISVAVRTRITEAQSITVMRERPAVGAAGKLYLFSEQSFCPSASKSLELTFGPAESSPVLASQISWKSFQPSFGAQPIAVPFTA
jgi:hypothetical protein